jgi:hypothetical protein
MVWNETAPEQLFCATDCAAEDTLSEYPYALLVSRAANSAGTALAESWVSVVDLKPVHPTMLNATLKKSARLKMRMNSITPPLVKLRVAVGERFLY